MEHPTREMTLDLIASRERMEDELKTLMEVLKSVTTVRKFLKNVCF